MSERHPGEAEADDGRDELPDPAASHGSDLDMRIGADTDGDDATGAEEADP